MVSDDGMMAEAEALDLRSVAEAFGLDEETSSRALLAVVLLHRKVAALESALAAAEHQAAVQREVAEALADGALVRPGAVAEAAE